MTAPFGIDLTALNYDNARPTPHVKSKDPKPLITPLGAWWTFRDRTRVRKTVSEERAHLDLQPAEG